LDKNQKMALKITEPKDDEQLALGKEITIKGTAYRRKANSYLTYVGANQVRVYAYDQIYVNAKDF